MCSHVSCMFPCQCDCVPMVLCLHVADSDLLLWTLTFSCVNACPPVNKPLNLWAKSCLFMAPLAIVRPYSIPYQWPGAWMNTMITIVTPWIRSSMLQLTMADPVKVMLETIRSPVTLPKPLYSNLFDFNDIIWCFQFNLKTHVQPKYKRFFLHCPGPLSGNFSKVMFLAASRIVWEHFYISLVICLGFQHINLELILTYS